MRLFLVTSIILLLSACSSLSERMIENDLSLQTLCEHYRGIPERDNRYRNASIKVINKKYGSLAACSEYMDRVTSDFFQNSSDENLCKRHMSFRKNAWEQIDIRHEIKRRGIDCYTYGNVAEAHAILDEIEAKNERQRRKERSAALQRAACKLGGKCSSTTNNVPRPSPTIQNLNRHLITSVPIVGGSLCKYSDGTVIRINGSYCPR